MIGFWRGLFNDLSISSPDIPAVMDKFDGINPSITAIVNIKDNLEFIPVGSLVNHNVRCDNVGSTIFVGDLNRITSNINITVPSNMELTMEQEFTHIACTLEPIATINFTTNNNPYKLQNPSTTENIVIKDMISFTNICEAINTTFVKGKKIKIDLSKVAAYLRADEDIGRELTGLFAEQNNMSFDLKKINIFMKKYFFELSGISARHTYGTYLSKLSPEVLERICSHLNLIDIKYARRSDVKLSVEHLNDHPALLGVENPTE